MNRKPYLFLFVLLAVSLPAVLFADEPKSWMDKIKISGDFRYRYEFIGQQAYSSGTKVRVHDLNRNRIRMRLGLQAMINSDVDAYFRLATSTANLNSNNASAGDPVSTNQDLSGGFTPKPIWIDRAYVDLHPASYKWLDARAGRQPVPFEAYDELVWDGDLNLEGVSLLLSHKMDKNELFLRGGGYWAGLRSPSVATHELSQGMFEGQVGGKFAFDNFGVNLAVAYIDWGNVKDNPTLYAPNNGFGNTLDSISGRSPDVLGYKNDYNLINVNLMAKLKLDQVEPGIIFDYVSNSAAVKDVTYNKDLKTGWLVGAFAQFKKLPVDWDILYDYRVVQKDAVIGAYNFSDPAGGGTNYSGHRISLGFMVLHNTRIGGTYLMDTKNADDPDSNRHLNYDRVQADLEVKF